MSIDKNIYKLRLHEMLYIKPTAVQPHTTVSYGGSVVRVPGGWLYIIYDSVAKQYLAPTFVPYDNEFY